MARKDIKMESRGKSEKTESRQKFTIFIQREITKILFASRQLIMWYTVLDKRRWFLRAVTNRMGHQRMEKMFTGVTKQIVQVGDKWLLWSGSVKRWMVGG
jgi:hypothetical protein